MNRRQRAVIYAVMTAILFLAFALRLHRLPDSNVWWDEGWTVYLGRMSLLQSAIRTAMDTHPPLHYWMIALWNRAVGESAFAVRYSSVLLGVLTVALMYRVGAVLFTRNLGLFAAGLLAVARFHIWWCQEIRMYALATLLSLASTFLLILWLRRSPAARRAPLFWYVVVSLAAVYAYYISALLIVSHNLYMLITILRARARGQDWRGLLTRWSVAQGAIIVGFAPWFLLSSRVAFIVWTSPPPLDFSFFLRVSATVLATGATTDLDRYTWLTLTLWGILIVQMGPRRHTKAHEGATRAHDGATKAHEGANGRRFADLQICSFAHLPICSFAHLLICTLLVPPILIYILSMPAFTRLYAAKFEARYLQIFLPSFLLLLTQTVHNAARWRRWGGVVGAVGVTGLVLYPLPEYYAGRFLTDDYYSLTRYVVAYAQPDDAVLLYTDYEWGTFAFYQPRPLEYYNVSYRKPVDEDVVKALLPFMWEEHDAVWLVTIPDALAKDPQGLVTAWLDRHGRKTFERVFGDNRLARYEKEPGLPLVVHNYRSRYAIESRFFLKKRLSGPVQLRGYDLAVRRYWPGDTLRLFLDWRVAVPLAEDYLYLYYPELKYEHKYQVRVAVLNRAGEMVQAATMPLRVDYLPAAWAVGDDVLADYPLRLSATVAPGRYRVRGEILSARGDELAAWSCGEITVVERVELSQAEELVITNPRAVRLGNRVEFAGYDLERMVYRAGDSIALTLYWRATRELDTSYTVFTHLLGETYNATTGNFIWGQVDSAPGGGQYPTTAWRVGELVRDPYVIPIQTDAPPGIYELEIGLYRKATGARLSLAEGGDSVILQTVRIEAK